MLTLEMIDRAAASMERAQKYEPPIFFVHPNWLLEDAEAVLASIEAEWPGAIVRVTDGPTPMTGPKR